MKAYAADPKSRLLTNALFKANLSDLAFCGEALGRHNFLFSIDIKTMASTNQKSTGRCCLFAATNLLRERIAKEKNLWDTALYEYDALTGLDTSLTKAEGLDYLNSAMNHAMVITGVHLDKVHLDKVHLDKVHLDKEKPVRWKIENSWGTADPNGGYFFMSDRWFDDYVYQAVIHKKHLGDKAALADTEPVVLKPWDPMGTLAD